MSYGRKSTIISSDLSYLIQEEMFRGKNGTLTKPRRSAFPKLINKTREFTIEDGELYITFKDVCENTVGYKFINNKKVPITNKQPAMISWRVENNNHAVESAHESPIGQLLLNDVLGKHKWLRGEGGVFYYIDEHMRDSDHDCGMGSSSSVSHTFGPAGKKHHENESKQINAMIKRLR